MRSILQYGIQLVIIIFTLYSLPVAVAQDRDLQEGITLDSLPPVDIFVQKTINSQTKSFQQEQKDWIDRIRKSKLLPAMTLQYGIGESSYSRFHRLNTTGNPEDIKAIPLDNDLRWQNDFRISLTWDLPNWIFSSSELSASEYQRLLKEFETRLISQVIDYYFELKEALIHLQNENERDKIEWQLKKQRNEARLDALTNGFLSEYMHQQPREGRTPVLQPSVNSRE